MVPKACARYLLVLAFLLTMALPATGLVHAVAISTAPSAAVADASAGAAPGGPALAGGVADVAGPRPHFGYSASVLAQATNAFVPDAGLQGPAPIISIPGWTVANESTDILSFDPVRRVMYMPNRPGNAAVAIDTTTNTILGNVPMPADCVNVIGPRGPSCPSGIQVAPDLRKLLVTDRGSRVFIYDISATATPQTPLATLILPNGASGADELEYDPVNHRAYVANGSGHFPPPIGTLQVSVADVAANVMLGAIVIPTVSLEQPRFNPVDGMVYQVDSGRNLLLRIDPTQGTVGAVVASFPIPCPVSGPTGLDIDPLTNVGLVGCGAGDPTPILDLGTGNVLQTFPQLGGEDGLYFNNNTRRWYTGSQSNPNPNVDACPVDTTTGTRPTPVVGVFAAGTGGSRTVGLVGGQCSSANAHSLGVDPIGNQIYVPGRQYPANVPGNVGVLVFHDPTPSQNPAGPANANLGSNGSVSSTPAGTGASVQASLTGLSGSGPVQLVVETTVGNEVVNCSGSGTTAVCFGSTSGAPLIGGQVLVTRNGAIVTRGTIAGGAAAPTPTPVTPVPTLTPLTPAPTATATPTNQSPTGATALAALQQGGFTANGVQPCAGLLNPTNPITPFGGINGIANQGIGTGIGSTCPITGQLTGSATITGSATWNVTVAAAPAGALVGVAPVAFALTTTNSVAPGEGPFACPALAAAGAAVTCNFQTAGNPLIGTTVAVCFATPGVGVGGVTCVFGQVGPATNVRPPVILPNLPVLPPPPLEFIPPPPPPLLPPPPPAPTGAAAAPVRGAFPEVPVIPEADSLFLVIGGLVALGGLVGYRRLRRRPDDDIA